MEILQALEFVRVETTVDGIFADAKLSNWNYEYNFLVQPDGKIQGRTAVGSWYELSRETTELIQAKIRFFMCNRKFSFN